MVKEAVVVADIALDTRKPTALTFDELYTWVIWQFPRKKDGGLCGAVHPPADDHGWFPAIIHYREECVLVHARTDGSFATPEAAFDYLNHGNGR